MAHYDYIVVLGLLHLKKKGSRVITSAPPTVTFCICLCACQGLNSGIAKDYEGHSGLERSLQGSISDL